MFSEYASRYLSKSQRAAPLFNGGGNGDSDVDDYLEAVSGTTEEGSIDTDSDSDSLNSESDSAQTDQTHHPSTDSNNPPSEFLIEQPSRPANQLHKSRSKPRQKQGYSMWKHNVDAWTRGTARNAFNAKRPTHAGTGPPMNVTSPGTSGPGPSGSGNGRSTAVQHNVSDLERGLPARTKPFENFVAVIYLVSLAFSLTTATLVAFSAPAKDSNHVYPIFVYSAHSLVVYGLLASVISALWLFCIRRFTRAVVQVSVFVVPILLGLTSALSVVMSVHYTPGGGHGMAHAAMRLSALVPLIVAVFWILYLRRLKDFVGKAADIVVLSAEVYNQCTPSMTALTVISGIGSLAVTGLWSFYLSKALLEGKVGILLIIWFSFMYLWSWGILCSLLRAVLAIVTAVWYAHPAADGPMLGGISATDGVLGTAIYKAATFHFSSICLSALIALLVRVPLLMLPTRLGRMVQNSVNLVLSSSATFILDPLTLPTSVLERCSLRTAAHTMSSPRFAILDKRAYRLAKLFLVAGRVCCSLLVGFIGWIHADRVQDASSAYGYLIAIIALFIGWTVMGASENMLSMICDALVVNYVINEESPRREKVASLFSAYDVENVNENVETETRSSGSNDSAGIQSQYSD